MVNKLSKKAGARLVVHSAKSSPLPDEFGIDLMPNTASSIAIQTVRELYVFIFLVGQSSF